MPTEKLDWMDFLNDACTWDSKAHAEEYVSKMAGVSIKLTPVQSASLSELEEYMRVQMASLHFGRELDLDFINQRLSKLHLHLMTKKGQSRYKNLPSLSAANSAPLKPIQQILDTLVYQFATFLGDTIDGGNSGNIQRCEALYRAKNVENCKSFYNKFRSLEYTWRDELIPTTQAPGDAERCADFFIALPGTKFCSDACRFNSFSFRKQTQTPGYQSEKQRRYRERQKAKN